MDNILNKHSDLPWEQRDTEIIGKYGSNETICEMILTGNHNELANAAFICKSANNFDSLLEALKEIASNYDLVKSTKNQTAITLCAKAKVAIQKTEQT